MVAAWLCRIRRTGDAMICSICRSARRGRSTGARKHNACFVISKTKIWSFTVSMCYFVNRIGKEGGGISLSSGQFDYRAGSRTPSIFGSCDTCVSSCWQMSPLVDQIGVFRLSACSLHAVSPFKQRGTGLYRSCRCLSSRHTFKSLIKEGLV